MFRIGVEEHGDTAVVRVEGKLEGGEAFDALSKSILGVPPNHIVVDLSGVTYVDAKGEDTLTLLNRMGVSFMATNCYTLDICSRCSLTMA